MRVLLIRVFCRGAEAAAEENRNPRAAHREGAFRYRGVLLALYGAP